MPSLHKYGILNGEARLGSRVSVVWQAWCLQVDTKSRWRMLCSLTPKRAGYGQGNMSPKFNLGLIEPAAIKKALKTSSIERSGLVVSISSSLHRLI